VRSGLKRRRSPDAVSTRSIAGPITVAWQPIVEVASGEVVAAEALARFPERAPTPTVEVFAQARAAGVGPALEAACLQIVLAARERLPPGVLASVNVSPTALCDPLVRATWPEDLSGVLVELTEQAASEDVAIDGAVAELRHRGAQLAVDDASTGYAGLLRLARLRPDVVKLDRDLVAGSEDKVDQRAVIEALVSLAHRIGARVIGEGVESLDDLIQLAALGVDQAQGWAIAPPAATLADVASGAVATCRRARAALLAGIGEAEFDRPSAAALATITAGLAGSREPADLDLTLQRAAQMLNVDNVSVSVLTADPHAAQPDSRSELQEIITVGGAPDTTTYQLADFPATERALRQDTLIETQLADVHSDPAERAFLNQVGYASQLLTPIQSGDHPVGVLEYLHHTHRRWTNRDIRHARLLAAHLASSLDRMA
jgi:EAL domain-containing protein (putative c-di-GMP-specific phosphodiesterase class I)